MSTGAATGQDLKFYRRKSFEVARCKTPPPGNASGEAPPTPVTGEARGTSSPLGGESWQPLGPSPGADTSPSGSESWSTLSDISSPPDGVVSLPVDAEVGSEVRKLFDTFNTSNKSACASDACPVLL